MKLYGLRVFVDDYEAARTFYVDTLGLPIVWEMAKHGALGVEVGGPQLIIEQTSRQGEDSDLIGRFLGVSLQVANIHDRYESLCQEGVIFNGPPEKQFWGGWLAHFEDPAGNTLTLLE